MIQVDHFNQTLTAATISTTYKPNLVNVVHLKKLVYVKKVDQKYNQCAFAFPLLDHPIDLLTVLASFLED